MTMTTNPVVELLLLLFLVVVVVAVVVALEMMIDSFDNDESLVGFYPNHYNLDRHDEQRVRHVGIHKMFVQLVITNPNHQ